MDLMSLVIGMVLGSCVTSLLIWVQRSTLRQQLPADYFRRVAMSVTLTAVLAGIVRTALDYQSTGGFSATGTWFASGWLLGGLLAAWFLTRSAARP